jgi:adenosylcobinamide-phosphate guanylyltransferase
MKKITALIMAGGKAVRMGGIEKPLIKICGKTMIEIILNALKNVKTIKDTYIATSKNTPNTELYLKKLGYKTITTSGQDYVTDLKEAVMKLNIKNSILILPSDLPLITSKTIKQLINIYIEKRSPPAMTFYIPYKILQALKIQTDYIETIDNITASPCGVSIIKGAYITQLTIPQTNIIIENIELALNVNTPSDIEKAQSILCSTYKIN